MFSAQGVNDRVTSCRQTHHTVRQTGAAPPHTEAEHGEITTMNETQTTTIYVALLHEGVDVWRPVDAEDLGDGVFRILVHDVGPHERWAFAPGARVRCETRTFADGESGLVAVAEASEAP